MPNKSHSCTRCCLVWIKKKKSFQLIELEYNGETQKLVASKIASKLLYYQHWLCVFVDVLFSWRVFKFTWTKELVIISFHVLICFLCCHYLSFLCSSNLKFCTLVFLPNNPTQNQQSMHQILFHLWFQCYFREFLLRWHINMILESCHSMLFINMFE